MAAKYPITENNTKICLNCEIEKSVSEYYWVKRNKKLDILSYCKICSNKLATALMKKKAEQKKIEKKVKKEIPIIITEKVCTKCKTLKSIEQYHVTNRKNKKYTMPYCKLCSNEANKNNRIKYKEKNNISYSTVWGSNNKDKKSAFDKTTRLKLKQKLVEGYGGKCTCCGEYRIEFLTLEHLNRDGKEHKLALTGKTKCGSSILYKDVINRNFPPEYTILCFCCNHSQSKGTPCPHKLQGQVLNLNYYSQYSNKLKKKFVDGYGGKCTCCGESELRFLTIEHINHDGKQHRIAINGSKDKGGKNIYRDVIRQGFPNIYTVLCINCNFAKKHKNPCPHELEDKIDNYEFYTNNSTILYEDNIDW